MIDNVTVVNLISMRKNRTNEKHAVCAQGALAYC